LAGQAADRGAVNLAVLDLADPGRADTHHVSDLPLGQVSGLPDLG